MLRRRFHAWLAATAIALAGPSAADQLNVLMPGALTGAMEPLGQAFQARSGHTVRAQYDLIGLIAARLKAGEPFDFALETTAQWDALAAAGLVDRNLRDPVARIGFAMYVRRGQPRPDTGSVEAVKASLLASNRIAYAVRGPIRAYQDGLMAELGLADALRPKLVLGRQPKPGEVGVIFEEVTRGNADIGFGMVPEILARPELDSLGPMPAGLDKPVLFVTVLPLRSDKPAAREFAAFLVSPEGRAILRQWGAAPD